MVAGTLPRPARASALVDWDRRRLKDTGCDYSPSCLRCPLPACRYDASAPPMIVRRSRERAGEAARLHGEGRSVNEIAASLGISRRSVFRLLTGGDE